MKRLGTYLGILAFAIGAFTCGAKVVVDSGTGGKDAGDLFACPTGPQDSEIKDLLGKPCTTAAQVCSSNNVCSGCSVTCTDGVWTQTGDALCFQAGPTC